MASAVAPAAAAVTATAAAYLLLSRRDAERPPVVQPVVLDWAQDDAHLRDALRGALQGTLSPMFAVKNYGFEALRAEAVRRARRRYKLHAYTGDEDCVSVSRLDGCEVALRRELRALCLRIGRLACGEGFAEALAQDRKTLDGRLSMRFYPTGGQGVLGQHVDGNLFTVLWADTQGLQVINPERAAPLTQDDILSIGVPSLSANGVAVEERQWASVGRFWEEDLLLVTVGMGWLRSRLQQACPVQCATLHRVKVEGPRRERHSIPFLVNVVDGDWEQYYDADDPYSQR